MAEIAQKSKNALYQRDYLAWASDVLGRRYYEKMAGIMQEMAHPSNGIIRNAIKSANGCGKSFAITDLGFWWVTAFPPEESLAIFSANGRHQIESVIFKYLKDAYGYTATRARQKPPLGPMPVGWINESLEWKYSKPDGSGNEAVAFGKRPADQDIVSTFQGTRKKRTLVCFDEMGGMPEDLFTAAEAVMTGEDSRFAGIGNPDRRATPFYNVFANQSPDWNLHTISAYELPSMTGEIVYPDEPEKQAAMLKGLTSRLWVAHKERAWMTGGELVPDDQFPDKPEYTRRVGGKPNGRFKAKVGGEFPGDADNTFFPEDDIINAQDVVIEPPDDERPVIGCDIATTGDDESVVYVNHGGNLRVFDKTVTYMDGDERRETTGVWSKEDELTAARRIHAIAKHVDAYEVRIDGGGIGSSVATYLMRSEEFEDRTYDVIRVVGSKSSSDIAQWRNWRDEIHAYFGNLMHDGKVDIDPEDKALRDELMLITYTLVSGAIKIDKKSAMKTVLGGSPDRADAAMYASLDTAVLMESPLGDDVAPGDVLSVDPWELMELERGSGDYPL